MKSEDTHSAENEKKQYLFFDDEIWTVISIGPKTSLNKACHSIIPRIYSVFRDPRNLGALHDRTARTGPDAPAYITYHS